MRNSLVAVALFAACAAGAVEVDGVAARVGAVAILKSDILAEMQQAGADPSRFKEFLDQTIERKLILKAAEDAKMVMQEWLVDNRVREIINRSFGGDRNRLMDVLARQKSSYPEWRAKLREDMVVGAMRWQVVDKNVTASPAALRAEYAAHPERYADGHRVTVSVILLKPEEAPKRTEIEDALKVTPFAEVARAHSCDSHAAEGGVWKDVDPAEVFKPEICEELARMPKGTLSRWIQIDGWSFLLRKDDESQGRTKSFEEAYDALERNVKDEAAARAFAAWIARLKEETYIKIY